MEVLLVVVIMIVIAVAAMILFAPHNKQEIPGLGITMEDAVLVNRSTLLSMTEPELALEMALRLEDEGRQLALRQVAPALLTGGHQNAALQALAELNEHHQQMALDSMLESLLDSDDAKGALALLETLAAPLPSAPLLRIPLLEASGEHEQAKALLISVGQAQEARDGEEVSSYEHLRLARLQRRLGLNDQAVQSLQRVWTLLTLPGVELNRAEAMSVMSEYAALNLFPQVMELAAQMSPDGKSDAIAVLLEGGQPDAAFAMLNELGDEAPYLIYDELMEWALGKNHQDIALRLLDNTPQNKADSLLEKLMNWHAARNETAEADTLLNTRTNEPTQRIWLQLSLSKSNLQTQPKWSETLLSEATLQLEQLHGNERWSWMRMAALETRLHAQCRLPSLSRDSYLIRTHLDEMVQLHQQLDWDDKLFKYCVQANLLHELGQTAQASLRLDEAVRLYEAGNPDPELGDADLNDDYKQYLLEDIALAYVSIDQHEKALALNEQLKQADFDSRELTQALFESHLKHERFEAAIDSLTLHNLLGTTGGLVQLRQALVNLHSSSPQRSLELQQLLLDTLCTKEQAWGFPTAA